jgi:hypothetical protein
MVEGAPVMARPAAQSCSWRVYGDPRVTLRSRRSTHRRWQWNHVAALATGSARIVASATADRPAPTGPKVPRTMGAAGNDRYIASDNPQRAASHAPCLLAAQGSPRPGGTGRATNTRFDGPGRTGTPGQARAWCGSLAPTNPPATPYGRRSGPTVSMTGEYRRTSGHPAPLLCPYRTNATVPPGGRHRPD